MYAIVGLFLESMPVIGVYDQETRASSVADLFGQLTAAVATINGQAIAPAAPNVLEIKRKRVTGAIVAICILLFPLGLLALFARPTETITVTVTDQDGRIRATATGAGDEQVVALVQMILRGEHLAVP